MSEAVAATAEAPVAPRKRPILLIAAIAVAVLAAGGGAAWYFLAGKSAAAPKAEQAAPAKPLFLALDPPFVVNFEAEQRVRFLQITVQLMTRDAGTVDLMKTNDPVIRDTLLMLLSNQPYSLISTREGKETLRKEALESVRRIVGTAGGDPKKVEALYFTSFVMQ